MKNLKPFSGKILTGILTLFIITVTVSCKQNHEQSAETITQEAIDTMRRDHIISSSQAAKMYKKYSKDRIKILKDTLKKKYGDDFKDTRNVWLSIADMKAYIKYIEDESAKIGANPEGLAFYFSVDVDSKGAKKNHQTFFVAPTEKNGDHQSGYTIVEGKKKFVYELLKQYESDSGQNMQKASIFNLALQDEGLLLNDTDDSPPMGNN